MKTSSLAAVFMAGLLSACALPDGRKDKIVVAKPYGEVLSRVESGVHEELEHGLTWSKDPVQSRRTDIASDAVQFELVQYALDLGYRQPFGSIYVRRVAPQSTQIDVVETPQPYGSDPYLADTISRWFPNAKRTELGPIPAKR